MNYPKVLILTPIYNGKEYCRKEFVNNTKKFTYPNFHHIFIDNSKGDSYTKKLRKEGLIVHRVPRGKSSREALANAQNYGASYAIKNDYDYVLSLESDIFPRPDVIQRLMKHWKPVVGSLYYIGGMPKANGTMQPRVPCVFVTTIKGEGKIGGTRLINREEHEKMISLSGLHRIHGMGVGCTLIDINILKKYRFFCDERFDNKHSDVYWYMTLWNDGIPVYVDYDVVSQHENSDWNKVKDR